VIVIGERELQRANAIPKRSSAARKISAPLDQATANNQPVAIPSHSAANQ
jgi:hypothetical protein